MLPAVAMGVNVGLPGDGVPYLALGHGCTHWRSRSAARPGLHAEWGRFISPQIEQTACGKSITSAVKISVLVGVSAPCHAGADFLFPEPCSCPFPMPFATPG